MVPFTPGSKVILEFPDVWKVLGSDLTLLGRQQKKRIKKSDATVG